jgi:hypothetical protein
MKMTSKCLLAGLLLCALMAAASAQDAKIAVLNPRGNPPPTPLVPMTPRPAGLDGKTVYFVDIKYEGGASLLRAIMNWFTKNIPTANLVFREKAGSYEQEDAKLWAEIKEKGDAVIMAVGH